MANVTIKIPDSPSPVYTVTVNGVKYSYSSGENVSVPDFVADVIKYSEDSKPKPGQSDYDPTGFTAHVRIVPGKESDEVSMSYFAQSIYTHLPNQKKLIDVMGNLLLRTPERIRAVSDVSEDIYVSASDPIGVTTFQGADVSVYAGGSSVGAITATTTIYDLLKDKDDKSILIISDYPKAYEPPALKLTGLSVSGDIPFANLTPSFDPDTYSYTLSFISGSGTCDLIATAGTGVDIAFFSGETAKQSGTGSVTQGFYADGDTGSWTIVVGSGDKTTTYNLTVTVAST